MTVSAAAYEIRAELHKYLRGEVSLDGFAAWLTDALWRLHDQQDETVDELAYEIELRLDEFSSGHWSEAELKDLLGVVAATQVIRVNREDVVLRTGTASVTEPTDISFGVSFVGTAHDTALS